MAKPRASRPVPCVHANSVRRHAGWTLSSSTALQLELRCFRRPCHSRWRTPAEPPDWLYRRPAPEPVPPGQPTAHRWRAPSAALIARKRKGRWSSFGGPFGPTQVVPGGPNLVQTVDVHAPEGSPDEPDPPSRGTRCGSDRLVTGVAGGRGRAARRCQLVRSACARVRAAGRLQRRAQPGHAPGPVRLGRNALRNRTLTLRYREQT
jgi:hypothetical protein